MAIFDRGFNEGFLARAYRKLLHSYYANDLWIDLRLHAKREAVDYIVANMQAALVRPDRLALLSFAFSRAPKEGLVLEFGVEKGASLRHLASLTPRMVHGFDSFEGLPGDWAGTKEAKGAFDLKGRLPKVPGNARLHVGWFDTDPAGVPGDAKRSLRADPYRLRHLRSRPPRFSRHSPDGSSPAP